jgi:hypothetical protein
MVEADAASIFRETGDRHGEGTALFTLGGTLAMVRRWVRPGSDRWSCRGSVGSG